MECARFLGVSERLGYLCTSTRPADEWALFYNDGPCTQNDADNLALLITEKFRNVSSDS